MIGGLADWFAVVAIFRHPLGIPIPHTAVIVARKDAFGETLGEFMSDYFLSADVVAERIRRTGVAQRTTDWLLESGRAAKIAGYGADLAVRLADVVEDDELVHLLEREVRARLEDIDVAPLAGRLLELATEEGRHGELIESVLRGLDTFLEENEDLLHERFTEESPWWVPGLIDDQIFRRLLRGVRSIIRGDTVGGSDALRERIDVAMERIITKLEHDDVWRARAEELKDEILDHPALREMIASAWKDTKVSIRAQAVDSGSTLRLRLTDMILTLTERVRHDEEMMERIDATAEKVAGALLETFGDEITRLISGTIEQWDGEETASRLELLLGRDLQFIRINGTVVGGLAGLVIHAVGQFAG